MCVEELVYLSVVGVVVVVVLGVQDHRSLHLGGGGQAIRQEVAGHPSFSLVSETSRARFLTEYLHRLQLLPLNRR